MPQSLRRLLLTTARINQDIEMPRRTPEDDSGAATVEYALLVCFIAVACVPGVLAVRLLVQALFDGVDLPA
jgi:Flp pilus assembly pilin Flp